MIALGCFTRAQVGPVVLDSIEAPLTVSGYQSGAKQEGHVQCLQLLIIHRIFLASLQKPQEERLYWMKAPEPPSWLWRKEFRTTAQLIRSSTFLRGLEPEPSSKLSEQRTSSLRPSEMLNYFTKGWACIHAAVTLVIYVYCSYSVVPLVAKNLTKYFLNGNLDKLIRIPNRFIQAAVHCRNLFHHLLSTVVFPE